MFVAKLRNLGADVDRDGVERLCAGALSAEEVARPIVDKLELDDMTVDWVWICLLALWGWGWIGWADCHLPWGGRPADLARAEPTAGLVGTVAWGRPANGQGGTQCAVSLRQRGEVQEMLRIPVGPMMITKAPARPRVR